MKKLMIFLTLIFLVSIAYPQGTPATWKKDGNKTWFQDYKTYNGFGTKTPTVAWEFVGNTKVTGTLEITSTASLGATTVPTLNTGQGAYELYKMNQDVDSTAKVKFSNVTTTGFNLHQNTGNAINSTGPISAAQMLGGVITSTSGAATSLTTPTATAIAALLKGGGVRGSYFDLIIDNSAGSNTVTLVLDGSITVNTPAITGGATLTVTTANSVGMFRFYFTSGTTAKVFRIF